MTGNPSVIGKGRVADDSGKMAMRAFLGTHIFEELYPNWRFITLYSGLQLSSATISFRTPVLEEYMD
jgi:hypothetical protein